MRMPPQKARNTFIQTVWAYYQSQGRHDLPWRTTRDPYRILVSEIMLQQTQVDRVRGFYTRFLEQFPTITTLAESTPARVITAWQGLGYNRRALALHRAAKEVVSRHNGKLPKDYDALLALPGIGPYTAGAVRAFAWNLPGVFLETNIRTVYIYHFFKTHAEVDDRDLLPIVTATSDQERPREWYAALMDYGTHLKATVGNLNRKSRTHTPQKKFEGSQRQLRGRILSLLTEQQPTKEELAALLGHDPRLEHTLETLTKEGFLRYARKRYALAN